MRYIVCLLVFVSVACSLLGRAEPASPSAKALEDRLPQFRKISKDAPPTPEKVPDGPLDIEQQIDTGTVDKKPGFVVQFDDLRNEWSTLMIPRMPGETVDFHIVDGPSDASYEIWNETGTNQSTGSQSWTWTAPQEPGFSRIEIREVSTGQSMTFQMMVLSPWSGTTYMGDYKIGRYEHELFKGVSTYAAPRGFIELTEENQDTWVSPHFQLKQFACIQKLDGKHTTDRELISRIFPKYLLLEPRLLLKLELLVEHLNATGIPTNGALYVHSAYRTPTYNSAIGNRTSYSRHCYGDAADVYVDANRNEMMDDLNANGSDGENSDATVLFEAVHEILTEPWQEPLIGGIGYYTKRDFRGPFVHVDARSYEVHWGKKKPPGALTIERYPNYVPPEDMEGPDPEAAERLLAIAEAQPPKAPYTTTIKLIDDAYLTEAAKIDLATELVEMEAAIEAEHQRQSDEGLIVAESELNQHTAEVATDQSTEDVAELDASQVVIIAAASNKPAQPEIDEAQEGADEEDEPTTSKNSPTWWDDLKLGLRSLWPWG